MFRAFLAGAGFAALLDSFLALPIRTVEGLRLEYLEWAIFGTLSVAIFMALVLKLVGSKFASMPVFARLQNGQAFWAGLIMGLVPILAALWPILAVPFLHRGICIALWCLPIMATLLLAPKAPRCFASTSKFLTPLALLAPVVGLLAFGFSSIQDQSRRPAPQLPVASDSVSAADGRPDFLLISIDTLRTDLQRGSIELLPILGELQKEGLWTEICLSTSNQTVPGHMGMLTGLEQDQHRVAQNGEMGRIIGRTLLQSHLRKAGYRTAGVISNAMVKGFGPGFEAFDDTRADYGPRFHFMRVAGGAPWFAKVYGPREATMMVEKWLGITVKTTLPPGMSAYTTESALTYLEGLTKSGDAPYHLFVHYMDAHSPYSPPAETKGRFANSADLPEALKPYEKDHRHLLNRIRWGLQEDETRESALQAAQHLRDMYDEEVLYLDIQVRRLIDAVRAKGRPTLVVLTSDHGEQFGEHDLMEHSNSLYGQLTNVPFAMVGINGFQAPVGELDEVVSLTDIFPTFAHAARISDPALFGSLRGVNLFGEEVPKKLKERIHLMSWKNPRMLTVAAQRGGWKVVAQFDLTGEPNKIPPFQRMEVFHVAEDLQETVNMLGQDLPSEVDELWERITEATFRWHEIGLFDPSKSGLSEAEKAQLIALGYLTGEEESD